jgi:hypothetical protein
MRRLGRIALWATLLLGTLIWVPTARAVPVVEKDDHTVNIDGSFKAFIFGMYFPFHPLNVRRLMLNPFNEPGAGKLEYGGMGMGDFRLKIEGEHHEKWKWKVHFRTQAQVSSFPGALGALSMAGGANPARSLPLQGTAPSGRRFTWRHELDRLMVSYRVGKVDIILGRQPISFGVGFVWKPADLVGTFSPTEVDGEYKPGVDALRVNIALGDFTELALVAAFGGPTCTSNVLPNGDRCEGYDPQFSVEHSVALARFRTNVKAVDFGVLAGWVRGDVVAGLFVTGSVKNFRIRSEVVYTWDVQEDGPDPDRTDWTSWNPYTGRFYAGMGNPQKKDDHFVRAIFGMDYKFDTKKSLTVLAEIYYNGFGRRHAKDYMALLMKPRVAEFGEVFNTGILYAALGVNWEPHHKLPLAMVIMSNLLDPSMFINATMTYKVGDESILVAGAMIPIGRAPSRGVLPFPLDDPGDNNPTNDLIIKSEYGLYPLVFYVQWKMYF